VIGQKHPAQKDGKSNNATSYLFAPDFFAKKAIFSGPLAKKILPPSVLS
jgi:hypothetical protein